MQGKGIAECDANTAGPATYENVFTCDAEIGGCWHMRIETEGHLFVLDTYTCQYNMSRINVGQAFAALVSQLQL
jgi:hypothetical protein